MRGARIGWAVAIALAFATPMFASDPPAVLTQAQEFLERQEFAEAINALERALPHARGNAQLLQRLRHAYRGEIQRLVAAEDRATAQQYIERLALIESPTEAPKAARPITYGTQESVKVIVPDATSLQAISPRESLWRSAPPVVDAGKTDSAKPSTVVEAPKAKIVAVQPNTEARSAAKTISSAEALAFIKQADALFLARRYIEAGELYGQANRWAPQPIAACADRWAYCRLARIVQQINSQPDEKVRWSVVANDVKAILPLIPGNEFAQSLLALAERNIKSNRIASATVEPVIRANEPERTDSKGTNLLTGLAARIGIASSEDSARRSLWRRFRSGPWQVLETSNFRVHASDGNLAGQIADIAECTRIELYRTWFGRLPESNWAPKCDIYIHDSAEQYARITKQGPGSPGHSQTGVDRGRITSRRIDLRRDGSDLTHAILPHEITHVVLVDRFSAKPIPRWADEGMAVLTEPDEKKQAHLRNLDASSDRNPILTSRQLMTMRDYPPGNQWPKFYAASVSLVDFLVSRGGPAKFIEFMEHSLASGYEIELKRIYGLASFEELDRAWSRGRAEQLAAAANQTVR